MMNTSSQQAAARGGTRGRLRSAFTLVELLAVISIIAILAGIFGMALGKGNSAQALPGAQSTLFSLVASARAQAILHQTNAMLLVYASSSSTDSAHNLNYLQVVYQDTATGYWVSSGDGVSLPSGVYVVPAGTAAYTATSQFPAALSGWPAQGGQVTICLPPTTSGAAVTTAGATTATCYYLGFNQFGVPVAASTNGYYGTLAVSTGAPTSATATTPTFSNAQNVRGLLLTQLGTPVLLNSVSDFPTN